MIWVIGVTDLFGASDAVLLTNVMTHTLWGERHGGDDADHYLRQSAQILLIYKTGAFP